MVTFGERFPANQSQFSCCCFHPGLFYLVSDFGTPFQLNGTTITSPLFPRIIPVNQPTSVYVKSDKKWVEPYLLVQSELCLQYLFRIIFNNLVHYELLINLIVFYQSLFKAFTKKNKKTCRNVFCLRQVYT